MAAVLEILSTLDISLIPIISWIQLTSRKIDIIPIDSRIRYNLFWLGFAIKERIISTKNNKILTNNVIFIGNEYDNSFIEHNVNIFWMKITYISKININISKNGLFII